MESGKKNLTGMNSKVREEIKWIWQLVTGFQGVL